MPKGNRAPAVATAGKPLSTTDTRMLAPGAAAVNAVAPWVADIESAVDRVIERRFDLLLEAVAARSLPKLLTRQDLSQWFGISTPKIKELEGEGLPVIRLGESIRYDVEAVQAWLDARSRNGGGECPSQ